ncbi:MAG TPA: cytochrome c oxidase assembly protein [Acidimicrobiales bacterium]|nr:cytochrome c oxidase assembly protein [Acidimicrobiales bacterium]
MTAAVDPWRFHAHPEVWLLLAGIIGLALFATRVIGPKVVRDGSPIVTRRQQAWFVTGLFTLWLAADWPMHDIGERYLYSAHMAQHLLLTMVVPPLFLLATPTWLARLIVGDGWFAGHIVRRLCRPVPAAVLFNAAFVFVHWPATVNASVQSGPLHFSLHVLIVSTALLMWMPVCGPLPEMRLSLPGQMFYLFIQSIIPTIPSAWLIFAEKPVYSAYDTGFHLWGINPVTDQQIAGVMMKLGEAIYIWGVILVLFFKWSSRHMEAERAGVAVSERDVLTWDAVQRELDELAHHGPAPTEPGPP